MGAHTLPPDTARRRQLVAVITLLVVVAAIFAALWFATRHNALHAEVGDCLHKTGSDTVKIIDCGSPDADFTVLGRVED
ncbi:hypothetical protein ACIBBG_34040 [Micromonospora chersina]|uniref:LppU/SCO3897 family protein n=1 Tax=Micromonospora chersina TaxID=47854 RepID=UPI00378B801D